MNKSRKLTSALALLALLFAVFAGSVSGAQAAPDPSALTLDTSSTLMLDGDDEDDPAGKLEDSDEDEDGDEDAASTGSASIIGSVGIASAAVVALAFLSQSASEIVEKVRGIGKKNKG